MPRKSTKSRPYRVLSIDGGGMRGFCSAVYLERLENYADQSIRKSSQSSKLQNKQPTKKPSPSSDSQSDVRKYRISKKFDMMVGTSTGAILACGLATQRRPAETVALYKEWGKDIFPEVLPSNPLKLLWQWLRRSGINKRGDRALRRALNRALGDTTLGQLWQQQKIAMVIPTVNLEASRSWVFKTPHNKNASGRYNNYALADVCLASSAAPFYRSLAVIGKKSREGETKDSYSNKKVFVDGGLWANNPVLVALAEALRKADADQDIEIFSLGTIPEMKGRVVKIKEPHWGFSKWLRNLPIEVSIDSQEFAFDYLADSFTKTINEMGGKKRVRIIRFPQRSPSGEQAKLITLDNASKDALRMMTMLADGAFEDTIRLINSRRADDRDQSSALKSLLDI